MKYIIEIEDKIFTGTGEPLYRAKGFDELFFNRNELNKLTPYEPNEKNEFKVGDLVVDNLGREGYVLVPSWRSKDCILLLEDHAFPQVVYKDGCRKISNQPSEMIKKFVEKAVEALHKENYPDIPF